MQSFSSRIWTRIAVSISYDDNHYTTGTSINLYTRKLFVYDSQNKGLVFQIYSLIFDISAKVVANHTIYKRLQKRRIYPSRNLFMYYRIWHQNAYMGWSAIKHKQPTICCNPLIFLISLFISIYLSIYLCSYPFIIISKYLFQYIHV